MCCAAGEKSKPGHFQYQNAFSMVMIILFPNCINIEEIVIKISQWRKLNTAPQSLQKQFQSYSENNMKIHNSVENWLQHIHKKMANWIAEQKLFLSR